MSQENQELVNSLKVRVFDAEEAARNAGNLVEELISFVVEKVDLDKEEIKSVEDFAKALSAKFPDAVED